LSGRGQGLIMAGACRAVFPSIVRNLDNKKNDETLTHVIRLFLILIIWFVYLTYIEFWFELRNLIWCWWNSDWNYFQWKKYSLIFVVRCRTFESLSGSIVSNYYLDSCQFGCRELINMFDICVHKYKCMDMCLCLDVSDILYF
jgi:hypothetical protein